MRGMDYNEKILSRLAVVSFPLYVARATPLRATTYVGVVWVDSHLQRPMK